jgi:hypothetical protein
MQNTSTLDHIVIAVPSLKEAAERFEKNYGITLQVGGKHPKFGTHNMLLKLKHKTNKTQYLEFIALDPKAEPYKAPLFGLSAPLKNWKVIAWAISTNDIHTLQNTLQHHDPFSYLTEIHDMHLIQENASLIHWDMAYSDDHFQHTQGTAPFLIKWRDAHPNENLPSVKVELNSLNICHPKITDLMKALLFNGFKDDQVTFQQNETPSLTLTLQINRCEILVI